MAAKGKQLRFDLERDLLLLRQAKAKGVGVFQRGHPALDKVAQELVTLHPDLFAGLSKKSARDRLNLLFEQPRKRENWNGKQSGTDEQFSEKTQLLLELQELANERETLSQKQSEDRQRGLAEAAKLRDNACQQLSRKRKHGVTTDPAYDEIEDSPFEEPTSTAQAKDQDKEQGNGRRKDKGKRRSYGSSAGVQSSTDTIVDYFREKNKESQALETQKLALERERLELARTEAAEIRETEKEEREARRIAEREERESRRRKEEDDRMERRAMLDILCRLADKLK